MLNFREKKQITKLSNFHQNQFALTKCDFVMLLAKHIIQVLPQKLFLHGCIYCTIDDICCKDLNISNGNTNFGWHLTRESIAYIIIFQEDSKFPSYFPPPHMT